MLCMLVYSKLGCYILVYPMLVYHVLVYPKFFVLQRAEFHLWADRFYASNTRFVNNNRLRVTQLIELYD